MPKKPTPVEAINIYECFILLPNQSFIKAVPIPTSLQGKKLKGMIGLSRAGHTNVSLGLDLAPSNVQISPEHPVEFDVVIGDGVIDIRVQNISEIQAAGFVMLTAR